MRNARNAADRKRHGCHNPETDDGPCAHHLEEPPALPRAAEGPLSQDIDRQGQSPDALCKYELHPQAIGAEHAPIWLRPLKGGGWFPHQA